MVLRPGLGLLSIRAVLSLPITYKIGLINYVAAYFVRDLTKVVQGTGFEPAKHYALGPKPSPFDRSGTPA